MLADVEAAPGSVGDIQGLARKAEEMKFGCFWVNETKHDPFVQLALAAAATERVEVGSAIALAFTRSPTAIAYAAWDLQALSKGRLLLGLGSQVKGHIERRFGVKWESPGPKMKEVVAAMREVWRTWQEGRSMRFDGRFFKLDLMTPFFSPGPINEPVIPVYVAGVNAGMWRIAGAVADGVHVHPLHTVRYLREDLEPALALGLERARRKRDEVRVAASVFAAPGEDRAEVKGKLEECRREIAFYASTRTYRRVMESHGWGDVCDRLHDLSVRGEWERMAREVPDEALDEFVVQGRWDELGSRIEEKYGGLVDRVRLYAPFDGRPHWESFAAGFRA